MSDLNQQLDVLQAMRTAVIRCCSTQLEVDRVLVFRAGLPLAFREKLVQADRALEAVGSLLSELEDEAWKFTRSLQESVAPSGLGG